MTEKEFETYWKVHRDEILSQSEEYRRAKDNFKMNSGSDLLLFGIPIVAGIVCMNNIALSNELLKWLASAVVTIVSFALCVWVKSIAKGSSSPDEVEQKLKERTRQDL